MNGTHFLQLSSKSCFKKENTSNFYINLPFTLTSEAILQEEKYVNIEIITMYIQGLWNVANETLFIRKTILGPSMPPIETEYKIDGGHYSFDVLLNFLNLIGVDNFRFEKTSTVVSNNEHIQLKRLIQPNIAIYKVELDISQSLATKLGFILPVIDMKQSVQERFVIDLISPPCDDSSQSSAAPSESTGTCQTKSNVSSDEATSEDGNTIVWRGHWTPSLYNDLIQFQVQVAGDYLKGYPPLITSPTFTNNTIFHTLANFNPSLESLEKNQLSTHILSPKNQLCTWINLKTKVLEFKVTNISGSTIPIASDGEIQLLLKISKPISENNLCF